MSPKKLFIFTGAYDCGKTTTMRYLADHFGYRIHPEAHGLILKQWGNRMNGHPDNQPYAPVRDPDHFCPMCNPLEFTQMTLEKQREIETNAHNGDLLERGFVDIFDYYQQKTGKPAIPENLQWKSTATYAGVFLLEPIPEAQQPRWGKSRAERLAEVIDINQQLKDYYRQAGYEVVPIEAAPVQSRAEKIHHWIERLLGTNAPGKENPGI
jgi:predicted ATPase